MGTIVFLSIALILFFNGNRKASLLLFCCMAYNYLYLIPLEIMVLNGTDGALVYMIIVTVVQNGKHLKSSAEDIILRRRIIEFSIFLFVSLFVSLFYFVLTPQQVFMGSRLYFIFLSYFFLRNVPAKDVVWIIKILFYITFVHSILYIIQFATGLPILGFTATLDELTGKYRFLNYPTFCVFFLFLTLFYPNVIGKKTPRWSAAIFLISLLCTLGRTTIFALVISSAIGIIDKNNFNLHRKKGLAIGLLILLFFALPFYNLIATRIENGGNTEEDIVSAMTGGAVELAHSGNMAFTEGNTFTYRLAWVVERANYMIEKPIPEGVFGLGFFAPKDNTLAYDTYHFSIGLPTDDGNPGQLFTADISYGNILVVFGFLGGLIYLLIWMRLFTINYSRRAANPFAHALSLFLIYLFIEGFAGKNLSTVSYLILPFMITHFTLSKKHFWRV